MAGIAGLGTTFDLPNYHGELFALGRQDHPFLSAIGGLTGGIKTIDAVEWEWQKYDLRAPSATRQALEGADAPAGENRVRANESNVTEIHHEAVAVSYTKLAATQQHAGINVDAPSPVISESAWQIEQEIKQTSRDVNASFIIGTYNKPADNTTKRRTRGLLQAITTNATVLSPAAPLTRDIVLDMMQDAYDNGGFREDESRTLLTNSTPLRQLSDIFVFDKFQETSRTVGGVAVRTITTDFGTVNIMLEPQMPQDTIAAVSLEQCKPVAMNIPKKGVFFVEPLSKTGATDKAQLYGEFGLEYGNETSHAKVSGIAPAV